MACFSDKNRTILIGKESTFGTPVTTDKDIGLVQSMPVEFSNNTENHYGIGNQLAQTSSAGNFDATASPSYLFQHGRLLEAFIGQSSDAETTGDYKHTLLSTADLPEDSYSFTMESALNGSTDYVHLIAGCKVNSLTFNLANPGNLTVDAEIFGSTEDASDATATTPVLSSLGVMPHFFATISFGAQGAEVEQDTVQSLSITMSRSIDTAIGKAIGRRTNECLKDQNLDVSFDFTMRFKDFVSYQRFLGGTSQSTGTPDDSALVVQITNGVTLGSGRTEVYFDLRGVQLQSYNESTDINSVVEASFTGTARNIYECYTVDDIASYF